MVARIVAVSWLWTKTRAPCNSNSVSQQPSEIDLLFISGDFITTEPLISQLFLSLEALYLNSFYYNSLFHAFSIFNFATLSQPIHRAFPFQFLYFLAAIIYLLQLYFRGITVCRGSGYNKDNWCVSGTWCNSHITPCKTLPINIKW